MDKYDRIEMLAEAKDLIEQAAQKIREATSGTSVEDMAELYTYRSLRAFAGHEFYSQTGNVEELINILENEDDDEDDDSPRLPAPHSTYPMPDSDIENLRRFCQRPNAKVEIRSGNDNAWTLVRVTKCSSEDYFETFGLPHLYQDFMITWRVAEEDLHLLEFTPDDDED